MNEWVQSCFFGGGAALFWFSYVWNYSQVVWMLTSLLKTGKAYSLEANIFLRYVSLFHVEAEPWGAVILGESLTFASRFLLFL